jgi:hypothetical protein
VVGRGRGDATARLGFFAVGAVARRLSLSGWGSAGRREAGQVVPRRARPDFRSPPRRAGSPCRLVARSGRTPRDGPRPARSSRATDIGRLLSDSGSLDRPQTQRPPICPWLCPMASRALPIPNGEPHAAAKVNAPSRTIGRGNTLRPAVLGSAEPGRAGRAIGAATSAVRAGRGGQVRTQWCGRNGRAQVTPPSRLAALKGVRCRGGSALATSRPRGLLLPHLANADSGGVPCRPPARWAGAQELFRRSWRRQMPERSTPSPGSLHAARRLREGRLRQGRLRQKRFATGGSSSFVRPVHVPRFT